MIGYEAGEADFGRPWGSWEVLAVPDGPGANYAVKRITVNPGGVLSLQRHRLRREHWIIVRGRARVEIDRDQFECGPDSVVFVPKGAWHRIACISEEPLVFIEVQTGEELREDDIERREDSYGRS